MKCPRCKKTGTVYLDLPLCCQSEECYCDGIISVKFKCSDGRCKYHRLYNRLTIKNSDWIENLVLDNISQQDVDDSVV